MPTPYLPRVNEPIDIAWYIYRSDLQSWIGCVLKNRRRFLWRKLMVTRRPTFINIVSLFARKFYNIFRSNEMISRERNNIFRSNEIMSNFFSTHVPLGAPYLRGSVCV